MFGGWGYAIRRYVSKLALTSMCSTWLAGGGTAMPASRMRST